MYFDVHSNMTDASRQIRSSGDEFIILLMFRPPIQVGLQDRIYLPNLKPCGKCYSTT